MLIRMLRPTHISGSHVGNALLRPVVVALAVILVSTSLVASERPDTFADQVEKIIAGGGEYFNNNGRE